MKVDGKDVAICAYVKGDGRSISESFKRRAYWLIDNPTFVIVHYFDSEAKHICYGSSCSGSGSNGTPSLHEHSQVEVRPEEQKGILVPDEVRTPF